MTSTVSPTPICQCTTRRRASWRHLNLPTFSVLWTSLSVVAVLVVLAHCSWGEQCSSGQAMADGERKGRRSVWIWHNGAALLLLLLPAMLFSHLRRQWDVHFRSLLLPKWDTEKRRKILWQLQSARCKSPKSGIDYKLLLELNAFTCPSALLSQAHFLLIFLFFICAIKISFILIILYAIFLLLHSLATINLSIISVFRYD